MNIYLDGAFAFGLARIVAAWLKTGQELSEERISELQKADESELAYQKALHYLSYRQRSAEEVRRNLVKKGFSEDMVEETLARLQRSGLINDADFAAAWVENRNTFHPRGKSILRMELRFKGIADGTIQSVLDNQVDEQTLALDAARKAARRFTGLELPEFRRKLAGFLGRRGFTYEVISPVISEIWQELQMADDGGHSENEDIP